MLILKPESITLAEVRIQLYYFRENDSFLGSCIITKIKTIKGVSYWIGGKELLICDNFHISKYVYSCTVKKLVIYDAIFTVEEFEFITSKNTIKRFSLYANDIYSDKNHVPVDIILQKLPNVTIFSYRNVNEKYSYGTLKNMNQIKFWNKLCRIGFMIYTVCDSFNAKLLCTFLKDLDASYSWLSVRHSSSAGWQALIDITLCVEKMFENNKNKLDIID